MNRFVMNARIVLEFASADDAETFGLAEQERWLADERCVEFEADLAADDA
jgi:hypothetical protein